jgi:hypothetical protein
VNCGFSSTSKAEALLLEVLRLRKRPRVVRGRQSRLILHQVRAEGGVKFFRQATFPNNYHRPPGFSQRLSDLGQAASARGRLSGSVWLITQMNSMS